MKYINNAQSVVIVYPNEHRLTFINVAVLKPLRVANNSSVGLILSK